MTLSNGEKILVDHASADMPAFLVELERNAFLLLSEIKGGSSAPAKEVVVASSQITLVRPLGIGATQGAELRPKR